MKSELVPVLTLRADEVRVGDVVHLAGTVHQVINIQASGGGRKRTVWFDDQNYLLWVVDRLVSVTRAYPDARAMVADRLRLGKR